MRTTASLLLVLALAISPNTHDASAETLAQSNFDTRVYVTFKVADGEVQKLLPSPWQVNPLAGGPAKGANLLFAFIDRLLAQDTEGKPQAGGVDRGLAIVVSAKNPQTGAAGFNVVRVYTANPQALPGPYKNSVQASMRLEQSMKATDVEPASMTERWEVRDTSGGIVSLQLEYPRAVPARSKSESKIYGGPDPDFFRIYRVVDQGTHLLKSVPSGVDHLKRYQLRVTMGDLKKIFDGSEQVISVAAVPWYVRQVFLP